MGFEFRQKLPTPTETRDMYPVPAAVAKIKEERDAEIRKIFTGESDKFLVMIGPCSADNEDALLDYVTRLVPIQEEIKDKVLIVPRIYTNKPRTTGEGYKGIMHQPDPEKKPDPLAGIIALRKMHIRALSETGLTAADEMLYPENLPYVSDFLSYIAIGARSVENQQHRLVSSGIDIPTGMKNPTSGDLTVMMNSIIAAQNSHSFIYRNWDVQTNGNDLAHAVLRGSVNQRGVSFPNYHYEDLRTLLDLYHTKGLKNPAVIIDSNHNNSNKQFKEQIRIVKEVLHSRSYSNDIKTLVKGVMIESYLEEGSQNIHDHIYGKSITDPCLGFEDSKRLLYEIADRC